MAGKNKGPRRGDFERAVWLLSQSVVHLEEARFNGSAKFKFFSFIFRPFVAMALCLELN